nr:23S rRNA (guanosine(2251)-2'-O)-methyltransferase RlmB [Lapidilactobacillus wuchangensis]
MYGKHAVLEYVKSGDPRSVNKIFMQKGLHGELASKVVDFSQKHKLVLQEVPKSRLDELTADGNHQGVLLTLAPYQYAEVSDILAKAKAADEAPLILILDNLNDPHNLGSILRTADAIGVHGVIIPKRRAVGVTAVVAKTATGALEHVLVARVTNLTATINELKEQGIWVFGTAMAGEDYRTWNSRGPVALVIGNEGKGISPLVAKTVDGMVTIPMIGHVQSLNASVATSILLYHMFDQRHPVNEISEK